MVIRYYKYGVWADVKDPFLTIRTTLLYEFGSSPVMREWCLPIRTISHPSMVWTNLSNVRSSMS
jgi:hypothetical protein